MFKNTIITAYKNDRNTRIVLIYYMTFLKEHVIDYIVTISAKHIKSGMSESLSLVS